MPKTESIGEALSLLKQHRAAIIQAARVTAAQIINERGGPGVGGVYAQEVRARMIADGTYHDFGNDFWLGAIWKRSEFRKTGQRMVIQGYKKPTTHEGKTSDVWTLVA